MKRISIKDLESLCTTLNTKTNNPQATYVSVRKMTKACIGNYHIDEAYSGYDLDQIVSEGGGTRNIFGGYRTKRELYNMIQAFIAGTNL